MPRNRVRQRPGSDLTPLEREVLRFCFDERQDIVQLIDLTTAVADLPRSLRGPWFDARLLTPQQKERHAQVVKDIKRALRRLFRAGLIDIGREQNYPEGFKRHHREIVAAMQTDSYWLGHAGVKGRAPSMDVVERSVRFHQTWADVTDLRSAVKEMGGDVELIGLTPAGFESARTQASEHAPNEAPSSSSP
jgi:hypothetical protein